MQNLIDAPSTFTGWVSDLARQHTLSLARQARREGLTGDEALDAVQEAFETFLRLPQARTLVGQVDDSQALMAVIVRNAARNMRKRHHRRRPHDADAVDTLAGMQVSVDDAIARAEAHVQLLGCVNRLGEVQRKVVTLRMLDEASGAATAEALGLPAGHVAVLLHRAKADLVACMSS